MGFPTQYSCAAVGAVLGFGLLACTRSDAGAEARGAAAPPAGRTVEITPAERAAVEDTVRKIIAASIAAQNRGDHGAVLAHYPDTGFLSAVGGMLVTRRDTVEHYMSAPRPAWLKNFALEGRVERVDVLAPDAAVATTTSTVRADSAGTPRMERHISTVVLANRGGRWVVVQEHSSPRP